MNVPERWWCWTATGEGDEPMPVVSCFAGSALDALEVSSSGPARVDRVAGRAQTRASAASPKEPCSRRGTTTRGSRAAYSISPSEDLTAALAEPVGPLAFAGEHTAGPFAALMEGAVRSGRRAAEQILRRHEPERR